MATHQTAQDLVDAANSLPEEEFIRSHIHHYLSDLSYTSSSDNKYDVSVAKAATLDPLDFEACFNLIQTTSATTYKNSSRGWHPSEKKTEMREPDMYYLLVRSLQDPTCIGFASFMITVEDDFPVVYLYEVHLSESLRSQGIGAHLMQVVETVGKHAGMAKAMLTVFTKNEGAERFYKKHGYNIDEYSPQPRTLRGGKVKRPDYVILSKSLR